MFEKIERLLINFIKENVGLSVTFKKQDFSTLPSIYLLCNGFSLEEMMGRNVKKKHEKEKFIGNEKTTDFKLKTMPLKLIHVSIDEKEIKDDAFVIDSVNGILKFRNAPPKDSKIFVEYTIAENIAEIHEVLVHFTYYLSIYSESREELSSILLKIISAIITKKDEFLNEGIAIKLGKVENEDVLDKKIYGMKMEISIDKKISIEVPVPKIEKIEITKK